MSPGNTRGKIHTHTHTQSAGFITVFRSKRFYDGIILSVWHTDPFTVLSLCCLCFDYCKVRFPNAIKMYLSRNWKQWQITQAQCSGKNLEIKIREAAQMSLCQPLPFNIQADCLLLLLWSLLLPLFLFPAPIKSTHILTSSFIVFPTFSHV